MKQRISLLYLTGPVKDYIQLEECYDIVQKAGLDYDMQLAVAISASNFNKIDRFALQDFVLRLGSAEQPDIRIVTALNANNLLSTEQKEQLNIPYEKIDLLDLKEVLDRRPLHQVPHLQSMRKYMVEGMPYVNSYRSMFYYGTMLAEQVLNQEIMQTLNYFGGYENTENVELYMNKEELPQHDEDYFSKFLMLFVQYKNAWTGIVHIIEALDQTTIDDYTKTFIKEQFHMCDQHLKKTRNEQH